MYAVNYLIKINLKCKNKKLILFMIKIVRETQSAIYHQELFKILRFNTRFAATPDFDATNSIAIAAVEVLFSSNASVIIKLTTSGQ